MSIKRASRRIVKLLDFLIRVLTKAVNAGQKILEDVQTVAEKSSKLADVLLIMLDIIHNIKTQKEKIEALMDKEE